MSCHASGARAHAHSPSSLTWWHGSLGAMTGTDKAVVQPKYRECFGTLVEGATELSLRGYDLDHNSMEEAQQSERAGMGPSTCTVI
eukprot:636659-Amphidinium_carterae.1